jgi:transcriptional regulator NrdR family protein
MKQTFIKPKQRVIAIRDWKERNEARIRKECEKCLLAHAKKLNW